MVRELKNHPGFFLEDAAAADFDRLEDRHGVFRVTSARRSEAEQQGLIDRWDRGGPANRPPWLYEPYRPAWKGPHVKGGGIALDIADWQRFMKVMSEGNFTHPYDWDVVHFEHNGNRETLNNEYNEELEMNKEEHDALMSIAAFVNTITTRDKILNGTEKDLSKSLIVQGLEASIDLWDRYVTDENQDGTKDYDLMQLMQNRVIPAINKLQASIENLNR